MTPRNKPLLIAGGAIIAGLVLVLVVRGTGNQHSDATADAAPVATAQAPATAPQQATHPAAEAYPWDAPAAAPVLAPIGATATAGAASAPPPLQPEALAAMREQIARSGAAADGMLRRLDEMESSGQLPKEIDLPALRNNIAIAKRAQYLSLEIVNLNQQPSTPERTQRLHTILAELQQLQGQLRLDVNLPAGQPASSGH